MTGYGGKWKLYSIKPDGSTRWTGEANAHLTAPRVEPDGVIFTGYEVKGLKAFCQETGRKIADFPVKLGFAENYHFTDDGDLLLVDDKGKMIKAHFTTREESLRTIRENALKGDEEEKQGIERGDGQVDIGGGRLPVKRDF